MISKNVRIVRIKVATFLGVKCHSSDIYPQEGNYPRPRGKNVLFGVRFWGMTSGPHHIRSNISKYELLVLVNSFYKSKMADIFKVIFQSDKKVRKYHLVHQKYPVHDLKWWKVSMIPYRESKETRKYRVIFILSSTTFPKDRWTISMNKFEL